MTIIILLHLRPIRLHAFCDLVRSGSESLAESSNCVSSAAQVQRAWRLQVVKPRDGSSTFTTQSVVAFVVSVSAYTRPSVASWAAVQNQVSIRSHAWKRRRWHCGRVGWIDL